MRPSRFTWPLHSNYTQYYSKSNNILDEDNFLHHMTPTSGSYVQIKSLHLNVFSIIFSARRRRDKILLDWTSGSHELWVNNLCVK